MFKNWFAAVIIAMAMVICTMIVCDTWAQIAGVHLK